LDPPIEGVVGILCNQVGGRLIADFDESIKRNPKSVPSHQGRAVARLQLSRPREAATAGADRPGLLAAAVSIYGLTMTNPMTILSFAAAFAGLGIVADNAIDAALITLGVWCGSTLWWVILTAVVAALRSRVTMRALTWINRGTGALIFAFGIVAIALGVSAALG
jgi:threonine/homoserine/homoserine lactone efflux protein